jgi:lipopolysaccharide/colanic/teichoic acid biosynthesis glycosyltransferase
MGARCRKKLFDLLVCGITAPVWLPVFALCAIAVLCVEGRPVFYVSQRRVQGKRLRSVVKFRTMIPNADRLVNRSTVPIRGQSFLNLSSDDPVYTQIGRLIERCCFTELPQVFQVLTGHMTIVGNRPLPEDVVAALRVNNPNVEDRFAVKAGITGPIQLIGRDRLSDHDRLRIELEYCRVCCFSYSWRMDLRILVHTVLVCLALEPCSSVDKILEWLENDARHPLHSTSQSTGSGRPPQSAECVRL